MQYNTIYIVCVNIVGVVKIYVTYTSKGKQQLENMCHVKK